MTYAEINMSNITFADIIPLANLSPGVTINKNHVFHEEDSYVEYVSTIKNSSLTFDISIFYIYTKISIEATKKLKKALREKSKTNTIVVYPSSLKKTTIDEIKQSEHKCITLYDYFLSLIQEQMDNYAEQIKKLSVEDYIDPRIETPALNTRRTPNPVLDFMRDGKGGIAVLLGEPGQGKTHMSKYLATKISNDDNHKGKFPIYVHSEQWARMQTEDLSSLWKTIALSFKYFSSPISWIDGSEEEFIKISLKIGVFQLVFDGFDEFVLWNGGKVDAKESLTNLIRLAKETETSICITSRTSFWATEINKTESDAENHNDLFEYYLRPFDSQHAKNYFSKYFERRIQEIAKANEATEKACNLFKELQKSLASGKEQSFIGRGFFLRLIADLVDVEKNDQELAIQEKKPKNMLKWIMVALCKREETRQNLPLNANQQLEVLRELAALTVENGTPATTEELRLILESIASTLKPHQITKLIGSNVKTAGQLISHPLINYRHPNWIYTQEQIKYALLAEYIYKSIRDKNLNYLAPIEGAFRKTSNLITDMASAMVEMLYEEEPINIFTEAIRETLLQFSVCPPRSRAVQAFAGCILMSASEKICNMKDSKSERTKNLLSLCPSEKISNLLFTGVMRSFDFTNQKFSNCIFDNVTFARCDFSNSTVIEGCEFINLTTEGGASGIEFFDLKAGNKYDPNSERLIEYAKIKAGKRKYEKTHLETDIDCLIRRFLPQETGLAKNVEDRNIYRGAIGHSLYKDKIVSEFKKLLLEPHSLRGIQIYSIKEECRSDFNFYVSNGVFVGRLNELYNNLLSDIFRNP